MNTALKCIQAQALLSHGNKVRLGLSVCNALTNKFTKLQLTLGQHSVQVSTLQHDRTGAAPPPNLFMSGNKFKKPASLKPFYARCLDEATLTVHFLRGSAYMEP